MKQKPEIVSGPAREPPQESLRNANARNSESLARLRNEKMMQRQIEDLKSQLEQRDNRIASLNDLLVEAEMLADSRGQELTVVTSTALNKARDPEIDAQIQDLKNRIDLLEGTEKALKSQLETMANQLRQAEKKNAELVTKLEETERKAAEELAQLSQRAGIERQYSESLLRRNKRYHKDQIQTLSNRLSQSENCVAELNTILAETEQKLAEARQETEATRALLDIEDSGDAQSLVDALKDINEGVDDMAFNFVESLALESVQVTKATLTAFCHALPAGRRWFLPLANAALTNKAATVQDFLCRVIVFWFQYYVLAQYIFLPFIPGMPREPSEMMKKLYGFVCRHEPQERSARWRAITYLRGWPNRDDSQLVAAIVEDFVSKLREVTPLLFAQGNAGVSLPKPDTITTHAQQLVLDAIKWQDRAKSSYFSFDFEPFFVAAGDGFNPVTMVPDEPFTGETLKGTKPEILIGAGAGLQAWRNVVGENMRMGKQYKVFTKAPAVCQNWLLSNTETEQNPSPAAC